MTRSVSVAERRRQLVARHRLSGDAAGPEDVVDAVLALHASDPATVYLSVLARSDAATLAGVSEALYGRRSLVRWMAMRRTLFVFARGDVAMAQAAIGDSVAAMLRRQLIARLTRNGSEPPIDGAAERWLAGVERQVDEALARRGAATGAELAAEVPALRTVIPAWAPSDRAAAITTALLTVMSADGRIVRGSPTGAWTSRSHRWEPLASLWPGGLGAIDPATARAELARRWLARFGPATADDLRWWTGWNQTTTRRTLAAIELEEVDLGGRSGLELRRRPSVVPGSAEPEDGDRSASGPVATLLPALDPTPMGYRHREWFMGVEPGAVFDRAGNIGPTIWVDGEIVGGWAITPAGELRSSIVADRGADARDAVLRAAEQLHRRLHGAVVVPAVRTPLERSLAGGEA